jgi:hypothetical protein
MDFYPYTLWIKKKTTLQLLMSSLNLFPKSLALKLRRFIILFQIRLSSRTCNFLKSLYEMTKITISNQSHKCYIGNTNQRMGVHGPLNISEVRSGAMEEQASPADRSHPP